MSLDVISILMLPLLLHLQVASLDSLRAKLLSVSHILLKQLKEKPEGSHVILPALSPKMSGPIHRTHRNSVACTNPKRHLIQDVVALRSLTPAALMPNKERS